MSLVIQRWHFAQSTKQGRIRRWGRKENNIYWLRVKMSKGPMKTQAFTWKLSPSWLPETPTATGINHRKYQLYKCDREWITFKKCINTQCIKNKISSVKVQFMCNHSSANKDRGKTCLNKFQGQVSHYQELMSWKQSKNIINSSYM